MMKKMIISIFLVFSLFFWTTYAEWEWKAYNDAKAVYDLSQQAVKSAQDNLNFAKESWDSSKISSAEAELLDAQNELTKAWDDLKEFWDKYIASDESKWDLSSIGFQISVNDTLGVWIKVEDKKTSEVLNRTLGTVIQKLMVALWVLSVLIMTVWAWYIILYHGQDELLSKGKSIFMAWITALVVALSSYYLVSILRFILYN